MAATTPKKSKKTIPTPWCDANTDVDSLSHNEQLAHQLVIRHRDLTPSVQRIMDAEIEEDARTWALTAFADSLDRIDDPNRDPRTAIANATAVTTA